MNTSAKIRLLLAIVCATFLLTAIIVRETFTPKVNLTQTGTVLQNNLNGKEEIIGQFINDKNKFDRLKTLDYDQKYAVKFIYNYTLAKRIWLYTYKNNHITFWSAVRILPDNPARYKEGNSFVKLSGGYYEVIKKSEGNFCALFFIPVKVYYPFHNKYLTSGFDKTLLTDNNIDIADFADKLVYDIRSVDGSYLFSIKLLPGNHNTRFFYFEFTLWLLGFLSLCVLVQSICNYIARKGYIATAFIALAGFICLVRFINLAYNWPNLSVFKLFRPDLYASSAIFPSLGDFCINMLAACWLAAFIYNKRHQILKGKPPLTLSYIIMVACNILLIGIATLLLKLYYGLVINSNISFDVTNVFNLSVYSLLGLLMLCFSFLLFFLLSEIFLTIVYQLSIPNKHKVYIFLFFIILATAYTFARHDASLFYALSGLFIAIRAYGIWFNNGKLEPTSFLFMIAISALISGLKLNHFQNIKELEVRKTLIQKLEVADDVVADELFAKIETQLTVDPVLTSYFNNTDNNEDYLKTHFQKSYFDGYLSRYNLKIYLFNVNGKPITSDRSYLLNDFKDLVAYSSIKVSKYFYHENDAFGYQNYFAILPVKAKGVDLGTAVVSLRSKPLFVNENFPELLVDGDTKLKEEFKGYSYAFYNDNHLLNQSGKYAYDLLNYNLKGQLKKYVVKHTKTSDAKWYEPLAGYNHLIYQPSKRYLIVVSHTEDPIAQFVTSLTFFFVVLLGFSAIILFSIWAWARIRIFSIQNQEIKWGFKINLDKILYRSRIQFSVFFTVVITLLLIGVITFQSISTQYREQQDDMIREKIRRIGNVFEQGLQQDIYSTTQAGQVKFNEFADTYAADLTLFNYKGIPVLTTQPKMYNYSLLARRMNRRAFIHMAKLHNSEFLNDEHLGNLDYKAAYVNIKNDKGSTVAFLQLPYFSNQADYNNRIGSLLNAMINIYALVFIAIGLFAIVIAREITSPLSFIQYNLSKTIYGQKNEPIVWERDDEIGALVKEYNKMIAELERSANKLAQSERETAWREMAKQVAHEIKNPLTPLKLGLQLLDKAWKDKDPKFDQKFERFSKSFVEQIESLSQIASEFSAFAKMPDTKLERVNLFEIINQAVTIFKQMDNVTINYYPGEPFFIQADRDQLLRCFNNLIKNAIEAVPDDRNAIIVIDYHNNNKQVLITVTDNGNGIPEHLRGKIFVPNFTTKSSGTGLGLAFVKNSIENAGGKIWFETETGKGTTFHLSLPADTEGKTAVS